jgi:ribosomal protein S3
MIKKILSYFSKEKYKETKFNKRHFFIKAKIKNYYSNLNGDHDFFEVDIYRICLILIKETKKKMIIEITSGRPEYLKGIKDKDIEGLKKLLNDTYNKEIEIKLKEYNVWG